MPDTPEIIPGTPEHDAAMAAKFSERSLGETPQAAESKPALEEGQHEKFLRKDGSYDWKSHAKELEWKASQKQPKADEVRAAAQKTEEPADTTDAEADIITKAGLDLDDLSEQIATTGDISAEARAALVKLGLPEKLINEHVENAKYRIRRERAEWFEPVGGEDGWKSLSEWAAANLADDEKTQINAMLGNPVLIKQGMLNLKARYEAATRSPEGALVVPGASEPGVSSVGFRTRAEQRAAFADPRYYTDPAYRDQVAARMRVSTYPGDR